jgi:general secretion pathway protein E
VQASEEIVEPNEITQSSIDNAVCEFLIKQDRLKETDLKRAENYRDQHGGDLVTLLVRLGLVSEKDVAEAESTLLKLPLVRTADLPDEAPELPGVSVRFLRQNLLLPVAEANGALTVVMANPRDEFTRKALAMASGKTIIPQVGIAS